MLRLNNDNLQHGTVTLNKLPVMQRLMDHILRSTEVCDDFPAPLTVGEVWETISAPGGPSRNFVMEFYSDQLDNPDCPIPARRFGKYFAFAFRKRDSANAY
jgi:hypothetical protein